MINLLDILQDAEKANSSELRLISAQRPMVRTRKGWHPLMEEEFSPAFVREQTLALLSDEERIELLEKGMISGSLQIKEKRFHYVFTRSDQGFNVYFSWKNAHVQLSDFALPPAVLEVFKKSVGVNIITGPRRSGRTTLVQLFAKEASEEQRRSIAVFTDQPEEYAEGSVTGLWQIFPIESLAMSHQLLRGFDFVVIDSHRVQAWRQAINIGEMGVRVLMTLPFATVQVAIERLSEKLETSTDIGRRRLAEVTQLVLNVRLVPAIEKGMQAAYELLLFTKDIRKAVIDNQWEIVEDLMSAVGEKAGMRTLNQCLMNLMMKRKIDVKAGFAESPRPEELDQMLEKVGF